MYLDEVAAAIRSKVPPHDLPEEDAVGLFRLYAVLLMAKGARVGTADVHNAWVAWMADRDPGHESLIPFEDLDHEVARMDGPFVRAIRQVAAERATE